MPQFVCHRLIGGYETKEETKVEAEGIRGAVKASLVQLHGEEGVTEQIAQMMGIANFEYDFHNQMAVGGYEDIRYIIEPVNMRDDVREPRFEPGTSNIFAK